MVHNAQELAPVQHKGDIYKAYEACCMVTSLRCRFYQNLCMAGLDSASKAWMRSCLRVFFAGGFVDEKNWIARKAPDTHFSGAPLTGSACLVWTCLGGWAHNVP